MAFRITTGCNGCGFCVQWCPTVAIQGRRKKVHEISAERCIDCGACGRICGQRAVVDAAGRPQERVRLVDWPRPRWDYTYCDGCGNCVEICPTGSVKMGNSGGSGSLEARMRPHLANPKGCISCGFCQRDCPQGSVELVSPLANFA